MVDQTTTKPVGLINELKICVHDIPNIIMFIILQNNLIDFSYSMLLRRPWLKDAKMAYDWGNNIVTIQRDGTVRTITVTKHLRGEVRILEVLLCYNYLNGITNEEKDIIFATCPKLLSIGTISLPKTIQSVKTIDVELMDITGESNISKLNFGVQNIEKKTTNNICGPGVALEDKVYLETYYNHQRGCIVVDETPSKIKTQEL